MTASETSSSKDFDADADRILEATGGLLPGPHAMIAGPTFTEWLKAN